MDIVLLSENSLRIKGKSASIVINPTPSSGKTEAQGVLKLWEYPGFSDQKVEEERILIVGPGDYEVGGIKVSTTRVGDKLVARLEVDGVKVLVGTGENIIKIADKVEGADIALINSDEAFNYSGLSSVEPRVLLAYGIKKEEFRKSLGKESIPPVSKFSITKDKLPEEMQVLLLG